MYSPVSPSMNLLHLCVRFPVIGCLALFGGAVAFVWPDNQPSRVVSFTFDDGDVSQYTQAFTILEERGIKATLYPISERPESYMTDTNIAEMYAAGWEIGAHTVSHPDITTLDRAALYYELGESRKTLREITGETPFTFASPYGEFNAESIEVVKEFYIAHLRAWGGNEGFNDLNNIDLMDIGRYELGDHHTIEEVCDIITTLKEDTWLVINSHRIVVSPEVRFDITPEVLAGVADCVAAERDAGRLIVEPVRDVLMRFETE